MTRDPMPVTSRAGALALAAALAACATPPAATTGGPPAAAPAAATTPTPAGQPTAAPAAPAKPGAAPAAQPSAPATAGGAGGASGAPAPVAARPPAPGTPPPFAEVTRDARSSSGFLTVWTRDEKTWLEIPTDRLGQPFFLGNSLAGGLGESFFLPGIQGAEQVVVLQRVGNTVQLVARNLGARAPAGSPLERALRESYADSLLAAAPLAAAPHPERKSLLVDASVLLGGDLMGVQTALETAFRMPYALDRANSSIESIRTSADGTFVTFRAHYAVPKLPAPPVSAPGAPPPNPAALPRPPRAVPDARSLLMAHTLTLAPLPAAPMQPRRADPRVGYFVESFVDYTSPTTSPDRRVHLINRWRLEKKDPSAAVSEPREPIRVVLDRNIPERWRDTVRAGVLEWSKAFERAGLRDALRVEQQPADADWSTFEGTRLLAVRWFAIDGPGALAVGPSQSDPRTGEILRGAAIVPENWVRFDRGAILDSRPPGSGLAAHANEGPLAGVAAAARDALGLPPGMAGGSGARPGEFAARFAQCEYASEALEHTAFGLELLQLRGDLAADSPEVTRYIEDGLKAVVTHEVGHALGLRHNFRASAGMSLAQLRDPEFTARNGNSHSVMDYNPPNTPLQGESVAGFHMPGLGAYDLWAIEYGYREFAPAEEAAALAALAAQSDSRPELAYGSDPDLALVDPSITQFDLGDDPLAYAQRLVALSRELWQRTEQRVLDADDDYSLYRRNLQRALGVSGRAVPLLLRVVGGQSTTRALAGSGKPLATPLPGPMQRAALDLLLGEMFTSRSFRIDPRFLTRMGFDRTDRRVDDGMEFSLPAAVATLQRGALDALMGEQLATRLADAETRVADPRTRVGFAEVQERLVRAAWSELRPAGKAAIEIDAMRRTLQREHARRLATGLVRPTPTAAADVRAVHRQVALQLEADLRATLASRRIDATTRAHLADTQAMLAEALRAPLVKQGV